MDKENKNNKNKQTIKHEKNAHDYLHNGEGYTDRDGHHYDKDYNYTGYTTSDGNHYDKNHNHTGYTDYDGNHYDTNHDRYSKFDTKISLSTKDTGHEKPKK